MSAGVEIDLSKCDVGPTILFCSLCHCSFTSFRSLSSSVFRVCRGYNGHTQTQVSVWMDSSGVSTTWCWKQKRWSELESVWRAGRTHQDELVALEYSRSVKQELAVLDVVPERWHVDLAEGHELLENKKWKSDHCRLIKQWTELNSMNKNHLLTRKVLCRFGHFGVTFCTLNICE